MCDQSFLSLKRLCRDACHERNACAKGYRQMLCAENVSQMMAVWLDNWEDVVESKFADYIRRALPTIYPEIKEEMNRAGVYLNECPRDAKRFVRVIVTDAESIVNIYGEAHAYVLGEADVCAFGHAEVINRNCEKSSVILQDYSCAHLTAGRCLAMDYSRLQCNCHVELEGHATCIAMGGEVYARSFRKIQAYGHTVVYSRRERQIELCGDATIQPLNPSNNEQ